MKKSSSFDARTKEAVEFARNCAKSAKSWIDFSNAMFGIGGKLGELFPSQSERIAFGKSKEHAEILALMEQLQDGDVTVPPDANGKFTVRGPRSLHAALLAEAEAEGVSLNQLCVTKLAAQLRALL